MTRICVALAGAGLLFACKPTFPPDPFEGAMHVPYPGQSVVIDEDRELPDEKVDTTPTRSTRGTYGPDIDQLQRWLETSWAHRARHEELDGLNVAEALDNLRDRVHGGSSREEFARSLRTALCRIGDAHVAMEETSAKGKWFTSGLRFEVMAEAFVIIGVESRYGTTPRAPHVGDVVTEVDGRPVGQYLMDSCLRGGSTPRHRDRVAIGTLSQRARLPGDPAPPESLTLRSRGDKERAVALKWRKYAAEERPVCVKGEALGPARGRITVRSFLCGETFAQQLDRAVADAADPKDLVIDLRDNVGGDEGAARMVAARVLTSAPAWTTSRKHEAGAPTPTEFTNEPFDAGEGPRAAAQRLWVLVGPGCAGTCEILASVLATHPQATVIGSPTAGSPMAGSGGAKPRTLAVSGFTVTVPTVEFALPGTTTLMEGRGVLPTVEVLGTPDSLANGDDLVLQAAIERIVP